MGQHTWTNKQTVLIARDLKFCFSHSEIPESKSIIKVVWYNYLQNCLHNCSQTGIRLWKQDNMTMFCMVYTL